MKLFHDIIVFSFSFLITITMIGLQGSRSHSFCFPSCCGWQRESRNAWNTGLPVICTFNPINLHPDKENHRNPQLFILEKR